MMLEILHAAAPRGWDLALALFLVVQAGGFCALVAVAAPVAGRRRVLDDRLDALDDLADRLATLEAQVGEIEALI